MVLFQTACLTRVWCVFELANWLSTKQTEGLILVPLSAPHCDAYLPRDEESPASAHCEGCSG